MKKYIIISVISIIILASGFIFFRYFFTYEQRNKVMRTIETVTGQNLRITVFDMNGKIVKRWVHVQKITSGGTGKNYTFFYTEDGKYVQLPDSIWYIAEEE